MNDRWSVISYYQYLTTDAQISATHVRGERSGVGVETILQSSINADLVAARPVLSQLFFSLPSFFLMMTMLPILMVSALCGFVVSDCALTPRHTMRPSNASRDCFIKFPFKVFCYWVFTANTAKRTSDELDWIPVLRSNVRFAFLSNPAIPLLRCLSSVRSSVSSSLSTAATSLL